eukprot:354728-Chlamydomonas_euryale.AAC.1
MRPRAAACDSGGEEGDPEVGRHGAGGRCAAGRKLPAAPEEAVLHGCVPRVHYYATHGHVRQCEVRM